MPSTTLDGDAASAIDPMVAVDCFLEIQSTSFIEVDPKGPLDIRPEGIFSVTTNSIAPLHIYRQWTAETVTLTNRDSFLCCCMATKRQPPRVRQDTSWSLVLRRPIVVTVHVLHGLTAIYFTLVAVVLCLLTPFQARMLRGTNIVASAVVYSIVAVMHIVPLVRSFWATYCHRSTRVVVDGPHLQNKTNHSFSIKRLLAWLVPARFKLPSNVKTGLSHLVELGAESWMAYQMAAHLVHTNVAFMYSMILTANCVFTTWVLFVKGSGLKKTLVDLMDSSISFTLSAGIPLVLVVTPLLVYLTQGYSAHNFTWRAEMLTSTRFFIASTPWQLAMNVAPSVANYITLQGILKRLNKRWRRASVKTMISVVVTHGSFRVLQQRNVRSTVKAMVVLGKDSFTTQHANSKWLKGMLVLCIVWGVAVATVAIASQLTRRPCPTGCVAQSAPWFTQSCNCIYFRLNCNSPRDLPVQNPLDGVHVTELGANLMLLHLIRCPVEEGVPNLAPFEFLQGILVEFSSMRSWEGVLPPSLSTVQVRYSDLTHVPAALRSPGPNLIELGLVGAPLGDISPTVVDSWGSVMSLALTATNLSSIPPGLLRLQVLETVALDSNRIVVVPDDEVAAVPQLVSLVLDSNRISTFPTKLMTANPQLHLSLSNNPIRAVPSDLTSQSTMSMDLAGSPYCLENPRDSSHCPSTCDTACTRSQSSNQVCDLPCNTSSCLYDMGDCLL